MKQLSKQYDMKKSAGHNNQTNSHNNQTNSNNTQANLFKFPIPIIPTISLMLILASSVIGLVSLQHQAWGKAGVVVWLLLYAIICWSAFLSLKEVIISSWKQRSFFTSLILVLFVVLLSYHAGLLRSLSGETTIAVSCVLDQLSQRADWGFVSNCFLGYPSRQYLIQAVPTLLFGRNQLSLNFGAVLYFLPGLFIFAHGLRTTLKPHRYRDQITALALISLFHFHFVNHFLFNQFEQSIFPLSLGLALCGTALKFIHSRNSSSLILAGVVLQHLIFAYTPSLALVGLGLTAMIFWLGWQAALKKLKLRQLAAGTLIVISSGINLYLSLQIRSDLKISRGTNFNYLPELLQAAQHLATGQEGIAFASPWLTPVLLVVIVVGLTTWLGWERLMLVLWLLAALAAAAVSHGYCVYGLDFRLHRGLVVVPVFLIILAELLKKITSPIKQLPQYGQRIAAAMMAGLIVVYLAAGLKYHFAYLNNRPNSAHLALITWLQKQNPEQTELFFADKYYDAFRSIDDALQYFLPEFDGQQYPSIAQTQCAVNTPGIYLINPDHRCYPQFKNNSRLKQLGLFHLKRPRGRSIYLAGFSADRPSR